MVDERFPIHDDESSPRGGSLPPSVLSSLRRFGPGSYSPCTTLPRIMRTSGVGCPNPFVFLPLHTRNAFLVNFIRRLRSLTLVFEGLVPRSVFIDNAGHGLYLPASLLSWKSSFFSLTFALV